MKTSCTIVKRRGHDEKYDEKKVYATCYNACINAQIERHQAEKVCAQITKSVTATIKKRKTISSVNLFKLIAKAISLKNKNAAFMYETHRDIC